jgi:hypothetical protein
LVREALRFKGLVKVIQRLSKAARLVCTANCGPRDARAVARVCIDPSTKERSMVTSRFGKKIRLPSTVQIKHQLLVMWLADQEKKEEAARASQMVDANTHWRQSGNAISNSV